MLPSTRMFHRILTKTGFRQTAEKKERRRSKRYRIDAPIRFRLYLPSRPEAPSPELPAQLYDISEHGLGLLTDTIEWGGLHMIDPNLQTSEKCILEMVLPYDDEEPLRVRGRSVWYIRHPEGIPFVFRVGVEFIDLDCETRQRIRNLINLHVTAAEIP